MPAWVIGGQEAVIEETPEERIIEQIVEPRFFILTVRVEEMLTMEGTTAEVTADRLSLNVLSISVELAGSRREQRGGNLSSRVG